MDRQETGVSLKHYLRNWPIVATRRRLIASAHITNPSLFRVVALAAALGNSESAKPALPKARSAALLAGALETALLLAAMFWLHGTPAPEVNEPHYLAKAKHFWDPTWCEKDMFLASPDVHLVFEYAFGWLTLYFPLPVVAWIGRDIAWLTLAAAWCYLTRAIVPRYGVAATSGLLLLLGVKHFHLAGEWLVGGIEAKCFSFPLVFLGLGLFLRNHWRSANIALGAATAMHVLTGGWAYLAMLVAAVLSKSVRSAGVFFQGLLLAALLGAIGIIPALLGTRSGPKQETSARMIYVYERLPHHLVLRDMALQRKERFALITAGWMVLVPLTLLAAAKRPTQEFTQAASRFSRFQTIVAATLLFALLGAALDQYSRIRPAEAAHFLRFYWFRASDIFVPAGFAIAVIALCQFLFACPNKFRAAISAIFLIACYFAFQDGQAERRLSVPRADASVIPHDNTPENSRSVTHENWVRVCQWIDRETPQGAIFWSARRQQSFKWYAQRAEVHNYKDIPQDPAGLLEWRSRLEVVREIARRGGIWNFSAQEILELQKKYGFEYVVIYKSGVHKPLPFDRVYPENDADNRHYEVYRLPALSKAMP
jgi:hypothetical protein